VRVEEREFCGKAGNWHSPGAERRLAVIFGSNEYLVLSWGERDGQPQLAPDGKKRCVYLVNLVLMGAAS
jgi:hypothetical protein